MPKTAVLGLGAMGARMATNLIKGGHEVTVWNRTIERARAFEAVGAHVARNPREAVTDVEFAISMVRDDEASRFVWLAPDHGALDGLAKTAVGIECSTLSVAWVDQLSDRFTEAGFEFLDAPVAGSRPQADAGQLVFLIGGNRSALDRAEPLLRTMGAAIHHAGPNGTGTLLKLSVNALFGTQVAAVAEVVGMLKRAGVNLETAVDIIASTPVCSPAAKVAAGAMLSGNFAPLFPVELVEKDFRYTLAAAGSADRAPIAAVVREVFARAIRQGFGEENLTGVVRLYG
jgi:3-hydroxyisobutyrate dehydrogenase